jgi:hypothetical protein
MSSKHLIIQNPETPIQYLGSIETITSTSCDESVKFESNHNSVASLTQAPYNQEDPPLESYILPPSLHSVSHQIPRNTSTLHNEYIQHSDYQTSTIGTTRLNRSSSEAIRRSAGELQLFLPSPHNPTLRSAHEMSKKSANQSEDDSKGATSKTGFTYGLLVLSRQTFQLTNSLKLWFVPLVPFTAWLALPLAPIGTDTIQNIYLFAFFHHFIYLFITGMLGRTYIIINNLNPI